MQVDRHGSLLRPPCHQKKMPCAKFRACFKDNAVELCLEGGVCIFYADQPARIAVV